jgi:nicotinamidase-related amidase
LAASNGENKEKLPMSLELDPSKTALVVIDLQNMIVGRPHLAPYSGPEVVERARKLAEAVRAKGGTVAYVHVLISETIQLPVDAPMQRPSEPPPPSASELVSEAGVQPGDIIITKRQWGAFYGTNLEQALDRRGIETIIMAGIATNMGVESTARAAFDAGYALVFAEDAMTTMSAEWHEFAIKNLFPRMGRVRSTAEIVGAL